MELIGENDTWVLRCKICHLYLSSPIASSSLKHKPTGESLATGITMSAAEYLKHCQGSCSEWRRLKHRVLTHLSGSTKTHQNASKYAKEQAALKNRQRIAIRNQLRTAIGVVQTKCAAVHYENKIAELHQAGADIGDFGNSRMLFPQMMMLRAISLIKRQRNTCLPIFQILAFRHIIMSVLTNRPIIEFRTR